MISWHGDTSTVVIISTKKIIAMRLVYKTRVNRNREMKRPTSDPSSTTSASSFPGSKMHRKIQRSYEKKVHETLVVVSCLLCVDSPNSPICCVGCSAWLMGSAAVSVCSSARRSFEKLSLPSGVKEIGLRVFACIRLNWALPAYDKHAHAKAQK